VLLALTSVVLTKVDPTQTSITGFSSGAFFAVQYHLAYSSSLKGAAIFAGGPFYCAQDNLMDAFEQCMEGLIPINLQQLQQDAQNYANNGMLDGLGNLTSQVVYIYSAEFDLTVNPAVVRQLEQMYRNFNVTKISTEYTILGSHTFPTTTYGNLCLESISPYISKCDYDGAGTALQAIYGTLQPAGSPNPSNIITLPQSKFTPGGVSPQSISLDTSAYLYVPTNCKNKNNVCKVHVALHGCSQYYQTVGDAFISNAGFNGWAESNNIIVIYPQTIASFLSPENPSGCWDWWGFNDQNYANNQGKHMQFMKNLVDFVVANF